MSKIIFGASYFPVQFGNSGKTSLTENPADNLTDNPKIGTHEYFVELYKKRDEKLEPQKIAEKKRAEEMLQQSQNDIAAIKKYAQELHPETPNKSIFQKFISLFTMNLITYAK